MKYKKNTKASLLTGMYLLLASCASANQDTPNQDTQGRAQFTQSEQRLDGMEGGAFVLLRDLCALPMMSGGNPASVAQKFNTPELAPHQAANFSASGHARAFAIPVYPSRMVMVYEESVHSCSIAIRTMDFQSFQRALSSAFSKNSALAQFRNFKLVGNDDTPKNIDRVYQYNNYAVFVLANDTPQNGRMQALISFDRVKK
jgi:hypothetical protein